MREAMLRVLREQRLALHTCLECPVKGRCVLVTPRYEPGYCLPEYKLAHALLAQRLRAHPRAGASISCDGEARRVVAWVRRNHPYLEASRPSVVAAALLRSGGPAAQAGLSAFDEA